ncbi:Longin-like domain-containing protein [Tribonema minus]|uniref:Longin-like domain-containing protein n=1 Tax=Tribonema minus TaxID=303371 RepID=A0A835YGH9_9STRA|nr:Longin-like domain-containing protein [Tribonema minus]
MIVYSLVARGKCVLAEYTQSAGNFPNITRILLGKVNTTEDGKMSYVYDKHVFHYIVEDGLIYLCLADEQSRRRIPFAFLEDIRRKFRAQYGARPHTALAFAMNEEFAPVLQRQQDYYNVDPSSDQLQSVRDQVDATKDIMVANIEKVLERGEKIELLVDKTDRLNQQAFNFDRASRQLQRALYWRKVRMYALLGGLIAALLLTLAASACGGYSFKACRSSGSRSASP